MYNLYLEHKAEVENVHDSIANKIILNELHPAYVANIELDMIDEIDLLVDFPMYVSEENPDQDTSHGINVTSGYVSTHGSFTEIHMEDGWLDSVNVFVWGLPCAAKIWLLIHPNFQTRFAQILKQQVSKAKLADGRASLRQLEMREMEGGGGRETV